MSLPEISSSGAFIPPALPKDPDVDRLVAAVVHCAAALEHRKKENVDAEWTSRFMAPLTLAARRLAEEDVNRLREHLRHIGRLVKRGGISARFLSFMDGLLAKPPDEVTTPQTPTARKRAVSLD